MFYFMRAFVLKMKNVLSFNDSLGPNIYMNIYFFGLRKSF